MPAVTSASDAIPSSTRETTAAAIREALLTGSRVRGLDFLRALAVSFVMLGHLTEGATNARWRVAGEFSGLGVKIFFVLSGFLITRLLLDEMDSSGRIDFGAFYRRRFARLMPAFYFYLAVSLTILFARGRAIPWGPVVSSVFYVTNYYQAFTGAQTNLVSHCWSLAVEEQFYLLWPGLAALLLRRRSDLARALAVAVLAVWSWRWLLIGTSHASVDYLYRALETRADDLATGCMLAVLLRSSHWRDRLAGIVAVPGIGVAACAAIYASTKAESLGVGVKYGFSYVVEAPLIAVLILSVVLSASRPGPICAILNNRFVVHVGQISYCMYLFHGLVGYTLQNAVERRSGSTLAGVLVAFASVIALSSASFRWFETPMRKWISGSAARH
jgi:peptidoglycan/LPS O-acetylase OafA/YrhL